MVNWFYPMADAQRHWTNYLTFLLYDVWVVLSSIFMTEYDLPTAWIKILQF